MIDPNDKIPEKGPLQPKRPGGFALIFFIAIAGIFIASLFRKYACDKGNFVF